MEKQNLPPHVARMVTEHVDLTDKIKGLELFLEGNVFPSLNEEDQWLLKTQHSAMLTYASLLKRRIDLATPYTGE